MPHQPWTKNDMPSLKGKLAIVTGATDDLGYEISLALAEAGATVILASQNESKGTESLEKIKTLCPEANVYFGQLDLGSLSSIQQFATEFNNKNSSLDILINNAGVVTPPKRKTTSDGFELHMGINHLGHFALTAQLLPSLRRSPSPRVVNISSEMSRIGKINLDDLQSEKSYSPWLSYTQSKLANLLFTFELQRKSFEGNWGLSAMAAHPGISKTDLMSNGPGNSSVTGWFTNKLLKPIIGQSAAQGALPALYAAVAPEAQPGGYYGPDGLFEIKGSPSPAFIHTSAQDIETAMKLWDISVALTGVTWC